MSALVPTEENTNRFIHVYSYGLTNDLQGLTTQCWGFVKFPSFQSSLGPRPPFCPTLEKSAMEFPVVIWVDGQHVAEIKAYQSNQSNRQESLSIEAVVAKFPYTFEVMGPPMSFLPL